SRAHCTDADTAWPMIRRPGVRWQVDRCLARAIKAHTGRPVVSNHRGYVDDCAFASLRHQRSKFRNQEIWNFDIERIHILKDFFRHLMCQTERKDSSTVDENIDVAVSEFYGSPCHLACARCVAKVRRYKIRFSFSLAHFSNRLL